MAEFRRRFIYVLLWIYKHGPSQVFWALGARCQHKPTCSEYGAECIARHGVWPGSWMTVARVSRCRPGGSAGWDPAPETKPEAPLFAPWKYGDWSTHYRDYPSERPDSVLEGGNPSKD